MNPNLTGIEQELSRRGINVEELKQRKLMQQQMQQQQIHRQQEQQPSFVNEIGTAISDVPKAFLHGAAMGGEAIGNFPHNLEKDLRSIFGSGNPEKNAPNNPISSSNFPIGGPVIAAGQGLYEGLRRLSSNPEDTFFQKGPHVDVGKELGLTDKWDRQLASELVKYAPAMVGGGAPTFGGRVGEQGLRGMAAGLIGEETPIESGWEHGAFGGALQGAGEPIAKGIGAAFGHVPSVNAMKNKLLDYLEGRAINHKANTPEKTRELLEGKYLGPNDEPLPVDIGTLTGERSTKGLYNIASEMPFSGGSKNKNIVQQGMQAREIVNIDNQIDLAKKLYQEENTTANRAIESLGNERSTIEDLANKERNDLFGIEENALRAPEILNELPGEMFDRTGKLVSPEKLGEYQTKTLKDIFKQNKNIGNKNYKELNDSTINIPVNRSVDFPKVNDFFNKEVENLLSTIKSIGQLPNTNISKQTQNKVEEAYNFLKNPNKNVNVSSMVQNIQELGKAAGKLENAGYRNEARIIRNYKNAFEGDFANVLKNKGQKDLADKFTESTKYWKENVVPFYENPTISEAAERGIIAKGGKLASAIFEPKNKSIWNMLSPGEKKAFAIARITGEKGTEKGIFKMDAKKLSDVIEGLTTHERQLLKNAAPNEYKYMSDLSNQFQVKNLKNQSVKQLEKQIDTIDKEIAKVPKGNVTERLKLEEKKEALKQGHLESKRPSSWPGLVNTFLGAGAAAAFPFAPGLVGAGSLVTGATIPIARRIQKGLTNPELTQAYIRGKRYPTETGKKADAMKKLTQLFGASGYPVQGEENGH